MGHFTESMHLTNCEHRDRAPILKPAGLAPAPHSVHADPTQTFDVAVIGAGPAGCAAATVLADHGHRVALMERSPLPRYRIGESLIPHCWFPLDRLGLVEALNKSSFVVPKCSVQFVSTDGAQTRPFYFTEHTDHPKGRTWQVVRSEFDQLLLERALTAGVTFFAETTATDLLRAGDGAHGPVVGIRARNSAGSFDLHAQVTVDASGRDLFAVQRNRWRVNDGSLRKLAIWKYFRGARRDTGRDAGATTIAYLPEKGWVWYLPLSDDLTSVGVVAEPEYLLREGRDHARIFERETARQPWVAERIASATAEEELHVTGDFSYRSRHCAEDGLILAGDALAFLDPVFSSGVYLALDGGVRAGDAVHAALVAGDTSARSFARYGEESIQQLDAMRHLVHAFYDPDFHFGKLFESHPQMRERVTEVLIGNLRQDFGDLFEVLEKFARIPKAPAGGTPRYS
jgi:flavin-dependent dehydrogenase